MKNVFLLLLPLLILQSCATTRDLQRQAESYLDQKAYHKALDAYEQLIRRDPMNPAYYYNCAVATFNTKRYVEAEKYAAQCIAVAPQQAEGYALHGRCLYMLKKYNAALAEQNRALELNPEFGKFHLERGFTNMALKDCRGAIKDMNNALRFHADSASTIYNRGAAYNQCELYNLALDDMNTTLKFWPDSHFIMHTRALSYMQLGNYEKAIADYLFSTAHAVDEDTGRANLAICYLKTGDTMRCIEQLNRTIEINPRFENALAMRAEIYYDLRQYERSLADAAEALRLNDTCFHALEMSALAYSQVGETTKAENMRERMRKMRPNDPVVYFNLFRNYLFFQQPDEALESIEHCIQLAPENYQYYNGKIQLLFELQQYEPALHAINEAEKLKAIDDTLLVSKGAVYFKLDSIALSVVCMKKATVINPENTQAWKSLVVLYGLQHKEKEAGIIIDKQLEIHPLDTFFLQSRIFYAKRNGKNNIALQDMATLLTIRPDFDIYISRAHILRGMGQYAAAAADYGKAAELNPGDSSAWLYRGDCYDLLGKKTLACADWKKACSLGNREGCNHVASECR